MKVAGNNSRAMTTQLIAVVARGRGPGGAGGGRKGMQYVELSTCQSNIQAVETNRQEQRRTAPNLDFFHQFTRQMTATSR